MYKFKDYPSKIVVSFQCKQELIDYLDKLCVNENLIKQDCKDEYLVEFDDAELLNFSDGPYCGFCLSGVDSSNNKRAHLLGYWAKENCNKNK